jgi:hypothetical protein
MHRLILLSSTYQMSSASSKEAFETDPANRLLSHMSRRRLEVEEIHDGMLAVGGELDLTMGGTLQTGFGTDEENGDARLSVAPETTRRRTCYLPLRRSNLPSLLNLFDFGDATTPTESAAAARRLWAPDYPWGLSPDQVEKEILACGTPSAGLEGDLYLFTELIEARRREPREDMVTALVEARVDGEGLSDAEIVSTIIVLLNAGHEATVNTLGNGVRALMRHPDEWRRLLTGEVSPAAAVEELIRWDPPLQLFERWVLEEGVEVAGRPIPRGQRLSLLFGSANRDPRVFDDPERFDLARPNAAEHIGFGGGIHVCIGAPLARIELEASLRTLVERAPGLTLAEEPRRNPAFVIWGLEGVNVKLQSNDHRSTSETGR